LGTYKPNCYDDEYSFFNTFNIISDFVLLRDTNINSPDIKKVIVKIYQDCNKKKLDNQMYN